VLRKRLPQVVDLGGREATPIPPSRYSCSAARSHPAGVAGFGRIGWPVSAGLRKKNGIPE